MFINPESGDGRLFFFKLPNIHNTTTLLLSNDGSTLYVGARNALLSLDISQSDVINLKKKVSDTCLSTRLTLCLPVSLSVCLSVVQVEWSPSETEINSCEAKGKNQTVRYATGS